LLPVAAQRAIGALQHAIFGEWIPNLKAGAALSAYESILRQRPDLAGDRASRLVAMRAAGKSIDNRFGEMTYSTLFWNRMLKDASVGSMLSLGWNLGFARDFGGGFFAPMVDRLGRQYGKGAPTPMKKLIRDTSTKTTNMFVYGLSAALFNSLMNYHYTGEYPEGMDYIFPRIGGLNPDGSPRRVTNAFYTREIPMAQKHIQDQGGSVVGGLSEMLYNKMMFQPVVEMLKNKDYFGNQIYDENAPFLSQVGQRLHHLWTDQMNPISIVGANRARQLSGKPPLSISGGLSQFNDRDTLMPLMGFGPAPAYVSRSETENKIQSLAKRFLYPEEKTPEEAAKFKAQSDAKQAYLGAKQRGDKEATKEAGKEMLKLGVKPGTIQTLQPGVSTAKTFTRLPAGVKRDLLKEMPAEDFLKYYPMIFPKGGRQPSADSIKLQRDPQLRALWNLYKSKQPSAQRTQP
jgi:hypothetical protein